MISVNYYMISTTLTYMLGHQPIVSQFVGFQVSLPDHVVGTADLLCSNLSSPDSYLGYGRDPPGKALPNRRCTTPYPASGLTGADPAGPNHPRAPCEFSRVRRAQHAEPELGNSRAELGDGRTKPGMPRPSSGAGTELDDSRAKLDDARAEFGFCWSSTIVVLSPSSAMAKPSSAVVEHKSAEYLPA
ncbi:hypothetical protein KSP39_PZI009164 [Platanthera zijinensis]|uniref:Uncharacterized protein n=1 Tax=Platanthera zijinensis TaxID=2320716 RepID=A0AAP0BKA7_9ASPA